MSVATSTAIGCAMDISCFGAASVASVCGGNIKIIIDRSAMRRTFPLITLIIFEYHILSKSPEMCTFPQAKSKHFIPNFIVKIFQN